MNKSYILKEIEFEALAAKEGLKSCWLFQNENAGDSPGALHRWTRQEEVEAVFRLVRKGLLHYTEKGAVTDAELRALFQLMRDAGCVIITESSEEGEQPSCLYVKGESSVLLSVPETDPDGIRLRGYSSFQDAVENVLNLYGIPTDDVSSEMQNMEEVCTEEVMEKDGAGRWIGWKIQSESEKDAFQQEELLYSEGRYGMELLWNDNGKKKAWYYTKNGLVKILRRMTEM